MLSIAVSPYFIAVLIVILIVWIALLTIIIVKDRQFYNRLLTGSQKTGLEKVLKELSLKIDANKLYTEKVDKDLKEEIIKSDGYLSRIGFTRFNPFEDTGGQQSFIVAVLDRKKNGFVLSSLYGRNGTRWFAKKILNGKGEQAELSVEEKQVVDNA